LLPCVRRTLGILTSHPGCLISPTIQTSKSVFAPQIRGRNCPETFNLQLALVSHTLFFRIYKKNYILQEEF